MERESKRKHLENYLYKENFDTSLRDRYKNRLSNSYILENELDQNNEVLIDQNNKEHNLDVLTAWDQSYQNMVEEQKNPKPSAKSFDQQVEQLNKYDGNTIVDAIISEPLAVVDMIFGQGFKWMVDIIDSYSAYWKQQPMGTKGNQLPLHLAGSLVLSYLKEGTGSIDGNKLIEAKKRLKEDETEYGKALNTLTSLYEYTTQKNAGEYDPKDKTLSNAWAGFFKEFLRDVFAIDDENLQKTISMKLLTSVGEATHAIGEYVNPKDPAVVFIPLDI